ncbi:GtrA family protein [Microbispora sp. NPDC046933]|uniref:GtrA family protein n=1 Tax=Microbispora sp. NPDC046933 TaxID=3155618 RepID=UPI0033C4AE9F
MISADGPHSVRADQPGGPTPLVRRVYRRFAGPFREFAAFGLVGAACFLIETTLFNLACFGLGLGAMTSKVLAASVATIFAYTGNRYWTWKDRERVGLTREYLLFYLLNGIALLMGLLLVGFTKYTLKWDTPLPLNAANVLGIGLGSIFRFWAYRKWVFLEATVPIISEPSKDDLQSGRVP